VKYVQNQPNEVLKHYHGLREAIPSLKAVAIFDCLDRGLPPDLAAIGTTWRRCEIENYLCYPETLEAYARATTQGEEVGPLFQDRRLEAMRAAIDGVVGALATLGKGSPWDATTKVSDDFLAPLFERYYRNLGLPNIMAKKNFHELARFVPEDKLDPEIIEKLDLIASAAESTREK